MSNSPAPVIPSHQVGAGSLSSLRLTSSARQQHGETQSHLSTSTDQRLGRRHTPESLRGHVQHLRLPLRFQAYSLRHKNTDVHISGDVWVQIISPYLCKMPTLTFDIKNTHNIGHLTGYVAEIH